MAKATVGCRRLGKELFEADCIDALALRIDEAVKCFPAQEDRSVVNPKRTVWVLEAQKVLVEKPHLSNKYLCEITGIDAKTLEKMRVELEKQEQIPVLKRLQGKDGKFRPRRIYREKVNYAQEG